MAIAATMSLLYNVIYSVLAYVVPGYQTFKAIEKRGSTEGIKDWAEYWVVLATFYVSQWLIDFVLCWLPFYYVAKLGFLLALWHPSTRLAQSIYGKVLSPLAITYEADIDRIHYEFRAKASDLVGQQAKTLKAQAYNMAGQASVLVKNMQQSIQQKAMSKQAVRGPASDPTAGHGLHTE